jgi:methyl halide transferase
VSHDLSPEYWNTRYLENDFAWDLGAISTPLLEYFKQLTRKDLRILIPGAGNSYEAEYLVNNGFQNVFVCDLAEQPLKNLLGRCPNFKRENLLHQDFFALAGMQFDLIIEQTFFCAIHPSMRKKYFSKMHELLVPGGRLVGLLFDDVLNNDKPPFGGNADEYRAYFRDLFTEHTFERAYNSIKPRSGRELFINLRKPLA